MEKISKNCYKGKLITDPHEITRLANERKSIYTPNWGIKPAAVLLSMQFVIIMRIINEKKLYYVEKCIDKTIEEVKTGGFDKYSEDLEKWENSFCCNECGCDKITDFYYDRTVANGEVWHCKHCKTEILVGHEPKEDNY